MRACNEEESFTEIPFNPPFEALVDYFNGGNELEKFIEHFAGRQQSTPDDRRPTAASDLLGGKRH